MFSPLPTPHEMAAWDRLSASEYGLLPELLMENASRAALEALRHEVGELSGKNVLVLAGPGNNGGDAAALARHLHDQGAQVLLLHTRPRADYKNEAAYHLELAARIGVPTLLAEEAVSPEKAWPASDSIQQTLSRRTAPGISFQLQNASGPFDIVVDGLLGTGLSGALRPDMLGLVRLVNELGKLALVLALDIPSGLCGHTGQPLPEAVKADLTVTFEAAKPGLAQPEARPYLGRLEVRPIGIPRAVRQAQAPSHVLMTSRLADLLDAPQPDMHKGTAGHVLVIGGSAGLTGAPMLAAVAAMRAGAGLVTIACPMGLAQAVKACNPEVMILPLGGSAAWSATLMDELAPRLAHFDAVVLGPGLGREAGAADFLKAYLSTASLPVVYDADALNILASEKELLKKLEESAILTPHPGEMARLLAWDIAQVQARRSECCQQLAQESGAVCVLKGAATVVAGPRGPVAVSPFSEPNLAVAGSGDVLSGIMGSLLTRGLGAFQSACLGVTWHGQAGKILSRNFPHRGNMPLEIAHALPQAIKELKEHAHC